jgi:glutamyl-Q tRNA(Asp) synthetase
MYTGRFAPSPTGPLHVGSLVAAVSSYLEARQAEGKWLVRMEDLDTPREMPGAADDILRTLEAFGMQWDGAVVYQSSRLEHYTEALERLRRHDLVYPCACSRKEIADSAISGIDGLIYPGTCSHGLPAGKTPRAWRVRVKDEVTECRDRIQGLISQNLARDIGDFVLKRADGIFAYQLAVVVDDALQGVTDIVRGADLLDSTPRQIYLQQVLALPKTSYSHVPVVANQRGEKLSKQTLAKPLDLTQPQLELWRALDFLQQKPWPELKQASLSTLWSWAKTHWRVDHIPNRRAITSSLE